MPTILVIDEDLATLEAAAHALGAAGHRVETATSARKGLALMARQPVDVVLLEVILDGKDGIETTMEIRRRWPELPVLAMSGGGAWLCGAEVLTLAVSVGACAALHKPLSADRLVGAIAEALARPEA